jgi:hypothetical protein
MVGCRVAAVSKIEPERNKRVCVQGTVYHPRNCEWMRHEEGFKSRNIRVNTIGIRIASPRITLIM